MCPILMFMVGAMATFFGDPIKDTVPTSNIYFGYNSNMYTPIGDSPKPGDFIL